MNKAHLDQKTANRLGYSFYRVSNDINGNPRYVIHFLAFLNPGEGEDLRDSYATAKKRANNIGFSVYRGKDFGGGFVCQSYNLESTAEAVVRSRAQTEAA